MPALSAEVSPVTTDLGPHQALANSQECSVLIVGNDPSVLRTLHSTLYSAGFDVAETRTGTEAAGLCRIVRYDVVLFDSAVPALRATELCRELRRSLPRAAIFILSDNDDPERKAEVLDAGADGYVTKPLEMRELTARIRSALRCIRAGSSRTNEPIMIGDVELHPVPRRISKAGKILHLTAKEFDLVHYLMSHVGWPVARSRLLEAVWGTEYADQLEYLRNIVRQVRKKLEDDPSNPRYLLTDSCIGYRFEDPTQAVHTSGRP